MEHCHEIAELADLAGLPAGDPRRSHLDSCPRCRGRAAAQNLFLEPGDTSDLKDLGGADAELARRLDPVLAASPATAARPARRRGPWYALAAVLAVGAIGLTTTELLRMRGGSAPAVGEHLRGEETAGLKVTVAAANVQIAWPDAPVLPDAGFFVFSLLGPGLEEVGRRVAQQPGFTGPVADLPAATAFCQAFAVSCGDTVARSGIVALRPARE